MIIAAASAAVLSALLLTAALRIRRDRLLAGAAREPRLWKS